MPSRASYRIAAFAALVLAPITAQAQARITVGAAGIYGQPVGEFSQNVRRAFGLDGFGTLGLDSRGIFSLRGELGYQQYASKSEPFLVSSGFGLFELESETKSGVLTMGIGPQLSAPAGPVRPYVAGTVGFARFATSTAINIPSDRSQSGSTETLDQQTISSDFIRSLAATAGIAFEVPAFGRGLQIDVGARYHWNGRARYVSSEGVVYNGTGTPTVTATESQADFIVYRLGIVIPIR
ncbi:MAG TPA: hypothetical protein VGP25_06305 [Gemmatimonadaceae bacterium]|jgi:hypothetical protein|nr:hypothetical protein [Gemmatimonadaceae bacterium]